MSTKAKFWRTLGIIMLIVTNYNCYLFIYNEGHKGKTYCGRVIDTSTKEERIKHGTRTDLYMTIAFDDIGTKSLEVSPTTYYTSNPGDRVCIDLTNHQAGIRTDKELMTEIWQLSCLVLASIADVLLIIFIVTSIVDRINASFDRYDERQ
jgi:hypothetical protein